MNDQRRSRTATVALIANMALLIDLIVFKAIPTFHIGHRIYRLGGTTGPGPSNFIPFLTISRFLDRRGNHLLSAANILGNIVPFMPVGFIAPFVFRSLNWMSALVLAIATGMLMEMLEWIFQVGIVDIDDVILNALGVMLGYAAFAAFIKRPA